jgi:hypothetical protein
MILFLADVGVKVNRKILLCKRSGGERGGGRAEVLSGRGALATDGRRKDFAQRSQRRGGHREEKNTTTKCAGPKAGLYIGNIRGD